MGLLDAGAGRPPGRNLNGADSAHAMAPVQAVRGISFIRDTLRRGMLSSHGIPGRRRVVNRKETQRVMAVGWVLSATLAGAQFVPVPPPMPPPALLAPDGVPSVGDTAERSVPDEPPPSASPPAHPPASAAGAGSREPLTLERLVQRARSQDARVEEARAELRRFEALLRQANWAWFPKFETRVGFGGPVPEARNDGLGGPPTTEASLEGDFNFGRMGVTAFAESNAVLPLYTFGKLQALEEAAEQGPVIGKALQSRAEDEAGFQAAQAFFGYQLARSGLAQLDEAAQRPG